MGDLRVKIKYTVRQHDAIAGLPGVTLTPPPNTPQEQKLLPLSVYSDLLQVPFSS